MNKKYIIVMLLIAGMVCGGFLFIFRFGGFAGFQSYVLGKVGSVVISLSSNEEFLTEVLGFEEPKTYILSILDNRVLTPYGGTPSVFVIVKVQDGIVDVVRIETSNFYKNDLQLGTELSKDFNSFALKVIDLFEDSSTEIGSVDGVIGGTTSAVVDFLALSEETEALQALDVMKNIMNNTIENSTEERLQVQQIIEQTLKEAKMNLFSQGREYVRLLKRLVAERQIVVFHRDRDILNVFSAKGLADTGQHGQHDFIAVIHSERSGPEINNSIQKHLSYSLAPADIHGYIGNVSVNYFYPNHILVRVPYDAHVKMYLPVGSVIKDTNVFSCSHNEEELAHICEGDVTVFPNKSKEVSVEYHLPETVTGDISEGAYTLWIKKQVGDAGFDFSAHIDIGKKLQSCAPFGSVVEFRDTFCDVSMFILSDISFTALVQ